MQTRRHFLQQAALLSTAAALPARGQPAARQPAASAPPEPYTGGLKTNANTPVLNQRSLSADLVVVGGGLAGTIAAISAARHGARVILVQDRPVLGGNASSEIRMGVMGSHGNNNKETGLFEELQLDNLYRNPLLRFTLWDDILYSAVIREKITLLLNTSVHSVQTANSTITSITAWNSNAYTQYTLSAKLFADCSGDAILRLSGAHWRMGREAASEFNETFRLTPDADAALMGSSLLMQLRKCEHHTPFTAPEWAYHFTDATFPKNKNPYPDNNNFWWIEYGGNLDTIKDANQIQYELKRIAYGVWEYMKNHPDKRCHNYELDWFGSLPGKRESARYIGDILLSQNDIMQGGRFPDAIAHGGWTLDDHHPDGFFFDGYQSAHHYPPTPFGLPYRMLYSRNINNLYFAGRNVSCTHIGMSATRVMATCAVMGQAAGTAAALALKHNCSPRQLGQNHIAELQDTLQDDDQLIPNRPRKIPSLTRQAAAQYEELRSGHDRHEENGAWLPDPSAKSHGHGDGYRWQSKPITHGILLNPGQTAEYTWPTPVSITRIRAIFDTHLTQRGKRMRKLEATSNPEPMPKPLAKSFAIETLQNGQWQQLLNEPENHLRLWRKTFAPVQTTAIRLKILSTWGAPAARLFSLEVA